MLSCWFCSRNQDQVQILITGDEAAICEQCTADCVQILNSQIKVPVVYFHADHERRKAAELLDQAGSLATEALSLLDQARPKP